MALTKIEVLKERRQAIEQAQTDAVNEFASKLAPLVADYLELVQNGVSDVWAHCTDELNKLRLAAVAPATPAKPSTATQIRIHLNAITDSLAEFKTKAATAEELKTTKRLTKYKLADLKKRLAALVTQKKLKLTGDKYSEAQPLHRSH